MKALQIAHQFIGYRYNYARVAKDLVRDAFCALTVDQNAICGLFLDQRRVYLKQARDANSPRILHSRIAPQRIAFVHKVKRTLRSEEHTSELQSRGHLVCRL